MRTRLRIGAGAHLDWLPQETILFEDSWLWRSLDVDMEEGSSLCALEAVLIGRDAMGGSGAPTPACGTTGASGGGGRLLHAEATRLSGTAGERDTLSLLAGARAFSSALYIGADAERRHARVLDVAPTGVRIGVSRMGERLVVRAGSPIPDLPCAGSSSLYSVSFRGAARLPRVWAL